MTPQEQSLLKELLKECALHLDGALGAAARPTSDSGDLYNRIVAAIGCPRDTNGDGNCGLPMCQICHPENFEPKERRKS